MTRQTLTPSEVAALRARHAGHFARWHGGRTVNAVIFLSLAGIAIFGLDRLGFSFERMYLGLDKLGWLFTFMLPPDPGAHTFTFLHALGETVAISFLGTLVAAVVGLPLGFLAARNILPNWAAHFVARRSLDTLRGIDILVWALIFVNVVGLGPFAGILAIAVNDTGTFGKLFSEAIEASDRGPAEGVRSTGGRRLHEIRFGFLPTVLPVILSQVLYYFESNTRSATIIGIVGAGGIGLHLAEAIRANEWQQVSFLVIVILITVAIIDWVSARLRFSIIGAKRA
jgi:phosphonate transport system permease protein